MKPLDKLNTQSGASRYRLDNALFVAGYRDEDFNTDIQAKAREIGDLMASSLEVKEALMFVISTARNAAIVRKQANAD